MSETDNIRIERAVVELWDDTAKIKRVFEIVPERGEKDVGVVLTINTDQREVPSVDGERSHFVTYAPGDHHIDMRLQGRIS
jgi:hypothetical protein